MNTYPHRIYRESKTAAAAWRFLTTKHDPAKVDNHDFIIIIRSNTVYLE